MNPLITEALAGEVRAALGRAGMTQAALAETTGISRATLSRRITGQQPFMVAELLQIADALGTRASDLMAAAERLLVKDPAA